MIALLVVALLLLLAVLISGVAERSVLSNAVLFLNSSTYDPLLYPYTRHVG